MKGVKLTGGHVLAITLGFFAAVFAVNGIFVTLALDTFPGLVIDKPYEHGVKYNEVLREKAKQAALGWSAEIERASLVDRQAEIALRLRAASGDALHGLDVSGQLRRPADADHDKAFSFAPAEDGAYVAHIDDVDAGLWELEATAKSAGGETFKLEKKLVLR